MPLIPQSDQDYLNDRAFDYDLTKVGNETHLILKNWPFPAAYMPRAADLLIRILPGYPLSSLDMFWTNPDIKLISGAWPQSSEVHEDYGGRTWQRWSRHTQEWRAGVDNLRTFITAVTMEINRGL